MFDFETRRKIKILLFGFVAKSKFLSKVYFFVFTNSFDDEFQSLVSGKHSYWRDLTKKNSKNFRLRRCIHVIEKGLIRPDRKKFFSKQYVEQALYILSETDCDLDPGDIFWAHDVLSEFFEIVSGKDADRLRYKFDKLNFSRSGRISNTILPNTKPFLREVSPSIISYAELFGLAQHRRSVRYFEPRRIEEEKLSRAFALASLAPSACNRQAFRFKVYQSQSEVRKIASLAPGASSFLQYIPAVVVVIAENRFSFQEKDRNIPFIDASLSSMLLSLSLETLGISSCIMNWPEDDLLNSQARPIVDLNHSEKIVFMMAIGYAKPHVSVPGSAKNIKFNLIG